MFNITFKKMKTNIYTSIKFFLKITNLTALCYLLKNKTKIYIFTKLRISLPL